jgi:hypothetical protein
VIEENLAHCQKEKVVTEKKQFQKIFFPLPNQQWNELHEEMVYTKKKKK